MYPSVCFGHFSSPTGTSASEENTILKVQPKGGSILRGDWGQYYKNNLTDRCPAGGSISRSKNPCIIIIIIIISPSSSSSFDFGMVPVMSVCLECWAFICTHQKKHPKCARVQPFGILRWGLSPLCCRKCSVVTPRGW